MFGENQKLQINVDIPDNKSFSCLRSCYLCAMQYAIPYCWCTLVQEWYIYNCSNIFHLNLVSIFSCSQLSHFSNNPNSMNETSGRDRKNYTSYFLAVESQNNVFFLCFTAPTFSFVELLFLRLLTWYLKDSRIANQQTFWQLLCWYYI